MACRRVNISCCYGYTHVSCCGGQRDRHTIAVYPWRSKSLLMQGRIRSVVVFQSQVCDQILAHDVAECVFEFYGLNEEVMLRVQVRRSHR